MHKFGTLIGAEDVPFRHGDTFQRERTTGPERLVIGRSRDHVATLRQLASLWSSPYWLLYVLVVPRGEGPEGRYQSPEPVDAAGLSAFLDRFRAYLQGDGRHHFWVAAESGAGTLVYDRHDILYAYGDLAAYEAELLQLGCRPGDVTIPVPHTHLYNREFDADGRALLADRAWIHSPLQEHDD